MDSSWSFHRRKGIFYVQFKNEQTGKYTTARSTGTTSEKEALLVLADWFKNGVPQPGSRPRRSVETFVTFDTTLQGIRTADLTTADAERIAGALKERGLLELAIVKGAKGSELVSDFLTRFWTLDESPYVAEKHACGQRIGRPHCLESLHRVQKHWVPAFEGGYLGQVTRQDLKELGRQLHERGLVASSINKVMTVGTTALKWAGENALLESNPAVGLMRYSGVAKLRGVLTPDEAQRLFALKWPDERSRAANLIAAVSGLRAGEVWALRIQDIGEDRLHVRHSWSGVDGLKSTKNGEERVVPLVPAVREELLELARKNPHENIPEPNRFVFYSTLADKPCDIKLLLTGLKEALVTLALGKSRNQVKRRRATREWSERGVVFHSWRRFYASRLVVLVELRQVQLATGHKSAVMAEHYAEHALDADFQVVGAAVAESFGNIVPFKKAASNQ